MQPIEAWTMIPFGIMLLMIAVLPLIAGKFWESNRNKLLCTLILAVPTAIYLICAGFGHELSHQVLGDYIPFIILLLALFVVTGGIMIKGDIEASPLTNALILGLGFILASFMGTTGAAMLLIRPLLEINKQRTHKTHTVLFFIAMVANAGGVLTPLGDPPLFLLYLRGAPFIWFSELLPEWLFTGAILLVIYAIWDSIMIKKEPLRARKADLSEQSPIRIKGRFNFALIIVILLSVIFLNQQYIPAMGRTDSFFLVRYLREIVLCGVIFLSLHFTPQQLRKVNKFSFDPILEVAIIFIGIFVTMTPALMFLREHAGSLGLTKPWQFYYSTGMLSSFLDNSPTALAFHSVATGLYPTALPGFVAGIPPTLLKAISLGAVFFGAMTYIGNGPNFMVKAIAEQYGVKMPGFFGYIGKFSLIVLLPVFILTQIIFL